MAVVHALKVWRCYLEGEEEFTVFTDHRANTFLDVQPTLSRRQTHWVKFLSRLYMKWTFKKGAENPADPLGRDPSFKACAMLGGKFSKSAMLNAIIRGKRMKTDGTIPEPYQVINQVLMSWFRCLSVHLSKGNAGRPGLKRRTPRTPHSPLQLLLTA